MPLTPAQVKTQIITGGISCLPACSGGLITGWIFNLAGCIEVVVVPGVGGSYPLAPGEIGKLYQPVDSPAGTLNDPPFYVRPEDQPDPFSLKHHVIIRFKFNGEVIEKEYIVSPQRAKTIVRVANFIERTQEHIKVVMNNFKEVSKHIVKIVNFREKRRK